MTPPNRRRRWMLSALLTLGVLCLPVFGFVWAGSLNYFASFNEAGSQSGGTMTWAAFGGSASVSGAQDVFEVVFPTPQDGEIEIRPNLGSTDASLVCGLTLPVDAKRCDIGFTLEAVSNFSDLDVRFSDVGDTGILDMHFNDDRHVAVDGQAVALPLLPGEIKLYVNVTLETSALGTQMWKLTLTGPTDSETISGTLNVPSMSLATIYFRRLAGQIGGTWHLDDVVVTSNDPSYPDFAASGAIRNP
jgi:hypothetical protein